MDEATLEALHEALCVLPTISSGHTDNLKIETADLRVWVSRLGPDDGFHECPIIVERLIDGRWEVADECA